MHHRLRKVVRQLYELGDLSWKLDEHQDKMMYREYRAWEKRRHKDKGANRIFMLDCSRQTGKSHCISIIRGEDCMQRPNSRFVYGSATEISLKEYVLPNIDGIFEDCPEDLKPRYHERFRGTRAHYRFPNQSILKIVGIDKDIDGMRGPKLHGANVDEAAFVDKLQEVVGSILQPQMQRVFDATIILSSSAPKDIDHAYDVIFKPSCERRKAYVFMTIHDNTALSEETKQEFLDAANEIDPVDAEREYLGKRVRSKQLTVFPEFDREVHCLRSYTLPAHGISLASYDPGQKHLFAVSWSVYDYLRAEVVFVDDWAEHNASTEKVAAVTAARELDLFGTSPTPHMHRLSVQEWQDLLANDRTQHLAEQLHDAAQEVYALSRTRDMYDGANSAFQWYDNDAKVWRGNPHLRVSDTNLSFINDMSTMFGIHINPTTKDDLREVMVQLVRSHLKQKRIKVTPQAIQTTQHLNACTWDKNRHKWIEHSVYSHFDLAATVVYGMRFWDGYYHLDPYPPKHLGRKGSDWVGEVEVIQKPIEYGDHW
jgi:hypothetical protein